jgi:RhoGAP domain
VLLEFLEFLTLFVLVPLLSDAASPPQELFCNPRRSSSAMLDAAAELPDALASLFTALAHPLCLSEPGMFQTAAGAHELLTVTKALNAENRVPVDEGGSSLVSPHALAGALLLFLRKLPQPLLTRGSYSAFLVCAREIGNREARNRNLRHLVEEVRRGVGGVSGRAAHRTQK